MKICSRGWLVAAALLTTAFLPGAAGSAPAETWNDIARFADEVFRLTNAARAEQQLPPLLRDTRLDKAAGQFSHYMGEARFFDHIGPDGIDVPKRIEAQGYHWTTWGENIAWGYRTPQEVLAGWMNSPGHRANILQKNYRDLGVGVAVVGGKTYMTQDFGATREPEKPREE